MSGDVFQPEHIAGGKIREEIVYRAVADEVVECEQGLEDDLLCGRMRRKPRHGVTEPRKLRSENSASSGPPYSAPRHSPCIQWLVVSQPSTQSYILSSSAEFTSTSSSSAVSLPPPSCGSVQTSKVPTREFADEVAGIFIQIILSLPGITFVMWMTVGHIVDSSSLSPLYSATPAPQNQTLHLRHRPCLSLHPRTEYSNRRNGWDKCWRPGRDLDLGWGSFGSKHLPAVSKQSS